MNDYVRKVVYLQEYYNHRVKGNVGYGRIEIQGNVLRVNISIKTDKSLYPNWKAYGYYKKEGTLVLVELGTLMKQDPGWGLTMNTKADSIKETEVSARKLNGILLRDGESHYCSEIPLENVKIQYARAQKETDAQKEEINEVVKQPEVKAAVEVTPPDTQEEMTSPPKVEIKDWAQKLISQTPNMYPFEDDELDTCVKLEPKDFGMLPVKEWVVSKNSFLLEGYYSYRHVIFAIKKTDNENEYYLGVPGVYHRRDKFMAGMFGFPFFKGVRKKEDALGDFGYWFRKVSEAD